jgi:hypothetical protein
MKKSLRYIGTLISVLLDVAKDETRFIWVPIHNLFRKKQKHEEFEDADFNYKPFKNNNA